MYKKTFLLTKPTVTDLLVKNTRNLIGAITKAVGSGGAVDVFLMLHQYATDVIAEFTYGPHGSTNSLVDTTYRHVAEQFALSDRRVYQLCQIHLPFVTKIYDRIVRVLSSKRKIGVFEYGWQAVQSVRKEKITDPEESLASLMMSSRNETFSDAYIASELLDHFIAGSDTTANTLTYLLHELSRPQNHSVQHRLHQEIMLINSNSISLSEIDKLPILDAVVREGLRVFSAIPFLEPREVPAGGRIINNYFLPEQVFPLSQSNV